MRSRNSTAGVVVVARTASVVLLVTLVTWFLIGQLRATPISTENGWDYNDYLFQVPSLPRWLEYVVALVGTGTLWWVLRPLNRTLSERWSAKGRWLLLIHALATGVAVGAGGRVITAGTSGANIGGGLLMMALPILVFGSWLAAAPIYRRANILRGS